MTPCIVADDLDLNEKLKIHYGKNKILTLAHLGNKRFRVEESKNIEGLISGDIVTISCFAIGFELDVSCIERVIPAREVSPAVRRNQRSSEELIPAGTFFGFINLGNKGVRVDDYFNTLQERKKNDRLLSSPYLTTKEEKELSTVLRY